MKINMTEEQVQALIDILPDGEIREYLERALVNEPHIQAVTNTVEYLDTPSGEELRVSTTYSGRGMYGNECLSVSGDEDDLMEFWGDLAAEHPETREYIGTPTKDQMGRGMVWYWPKVMTRKGRGY